MSELELIDAPRAKTNRIGFFGKVPTHGDFVSKGLSRTSLTRIDNWILSGLRACEREHGAVWRELFRSAPAWRFVVDRSIWGDAALVGVLLPSRDRVGRNFPLVIAAALDGFGGNPRQLCFDDRWFMAAEALGETSLAQDFSTAGFAAGLERLGMPRVRFGDAPALANGKPVTLWWSVHTGSARPDGFATVGEPAPEDFLKLLSTARQPQQAAEIEREGRLEPDDAAPNNGATADPAAARPATPANSLVNFPARASTWPFVTEHSFATHPGTRLDVNTDSLLVSESPCLFAIADGAGGDSAAANAARVTTNTLAAAEPHGDFVSLVQEVKGKLGRAHGLLQASHEDERSAPPSASVAALTLLRDEYAVLWAGNTRCYLLRGGMMRALTRDHTQTGLRLTLSRSIGARGPLMPEIVSDAVQPGDRFLLCNFGLVKTLSERTIADVLLTTPVSEAAAALIQDALIEHASGTLSAIVAEVRRP